MNDPLHNYYCIVYLFLLANIYYLLPENEDKQLWNPGHLVSKDVEEYLSKSQEAIQTGGVGSLPMGAHVRDDEQVWL